MKLILFAAVSILVTSAAEHARGKMVQLCGAELSRAVKLVCEGDDLELSNLQHVQKYHHEHNHNHEGYQGHEGHESKTHATKRDSSHSLVEECCTKPCHVKDIATYCP